MLVDEGLELLTDDDARALLATAEIGRVGVSIDAIPAIFPVNFVVIDRDILFRTAEGSKLTAAMHKAVVAFEVDDHHRSTRSGWSVLVVGRSEIVHDLDITWRAVQAGLEPWADGRRGHIVRICAELVTGRRIVHERAVSDQAGAVPHQS